MPNSTSENVLGNLVINNQGEILRSGGELENDENVAKVILEIVSTIPPEQKVKRFSLHYSNHAYTVVVSKDAQILVQKLRRQPLRDDFFDEE